ncbi:hypothetical protein J2X11_000348 [Aeromicrobium panaciterrae]|uniref:DUF3566 domain-containing protein n=1 Tax=Aeromicrobium panaciterrae TaxID=363861 RepID=A0ABU1UK00_9ACTN|nr:DUF3566 domain-containing protein [Aeromicrobium panaciterrae]MDR7085509.1 hypothetical protein [Aeromicrobium panaciterrae]
MNDERQEPDSVPGSGAGDAATSQAIPRLPKPVKKIAPKKKPGLKQAEAATDESSDDVATDEDSTDETETTEAPAVNSMGSETDKGRAREIAAAEAKIAPTKAEKPRRIEPVKPTRPLTAADYARTTTPSPATTSVIPAVKDEPLAAAPAAAPAVASNRQASLRLNHIEPWSVARIAFAVSVAMMIVGVVAMTIFWVVLNVAGVWDQVNEAVTSVLSDDSSSFDITDYLGFWRLIGLTLVLSAINVVLMTALATIGAHLYNLAAQVLGGVEVTFGEEN